MGLCWDSAGFVRGSKSLEHIHELYLDVLMVSGEVLQVLQEGTLVFS